MDNESFSVKLPPEWQCEPVDVAAITKWCDSHGVPVDDFARLTDHEQQAIAVGQLGLDIEALAAALDWIRGRHRFIVRVVTEMMDTWGKSSDGSAQPRSH